MSRMTSKSWAAAGALSLLTLVFVPHPALAQEQTCKGLSELPCSFNIRELKLQKVPALFQFQSRISQAKLPLGDATFQTVVVKVLRGTEPVCMEEIHDVVVQGSVLNLTIGQQMNCELAEVIAENPNLAFQICLGGPANCLKPIELSTTPYAIKATYASLAQQAHRANVAGQASYAHRATADRDLFLRKKLGAGYFDFYTHTGADAVALYTADDYAPYEDGGFIQWTPVRNPTARTLHIVAKDQATDQLDLLDELVLAAAVTHARGDLVVDASPDGQGLVVTAAGAHVTGDSDFADALEILGTLTAQGAILVHGDATIEGSLSVAQGVIVQAGGVHAAGSSSVAGTLGITGGLTVQAGMEVVGDLLVNGQLTAASAQVDAALSVSGDATLGTLTTDSATIQGAVSASSAAVSGATEIGGDLTVSGQMGVTGPAVFKGHVVFEQGSSEPEGAADARYVLAKDEARDLSFGGKVSFGKAVSFLGQVDMTGHQVQNMRFEASAGAPKACAAETEGFFYLDTTLEKVRFCIGGTYKTLGGDECGNGNVEPTEACDDGNLSSGDGCSAGCVAETPGWTCTGKGVQPTTCDTTCGDGWPRGAETCDDQNTAPLDGCDATCQTEAGFVCTGEPSDCQTVCGDGVIAGAETCDDGNADALDGCDASCTIETGWSCSGAPSDCVFGICGDGMIMPSLGEVCDDGNTAANDGCSDCQVDSGYACHAEPSLCFQHKTTTLLHPQGNYLSIQIPAKVDFITIEGWGAYGQSAGIGLGGAPGRVKVKVDMSKSPTHTLSIKVGALGGFPDAEISYWASGGGSSIVSNGGSTYFLYVGGGGGASTSSSWGPPNGGCGGISGTGGGGKNPGQGGTLTHGGQGGGGCTTHDGNGKYHYAGRPVPAGTDTLCIGLYGNPAGGGGGWYGGGAGAYGGGGGGSSYFDPSMGTLVDSTNCATNSPGGNSGAVRVSW